MAFSDDFTGTSGQGLGERDGWTQLQGTADDAKITNSNQLERTTTGGGKLFYATSDDEAPSQTVKADFFHGINIGTVVFGSVSGGAFSGYVLRAQANLLSCRLWKIIDDGTPALLVASSATPDCIGLELRVSLNGNGDPVLTVFRQGIQIATHTDTSGTKITSGRRGITFPTISSTGGGALDNYEDNSGEGGGEEIAFTLSERSTAFPLKPGRTHNWTLTFTGEPASIEARWVDRDGNAISGQNWQEVDDDPTGGSSAFAVNAPSTPGDYRLQVRDGEETATGITSGFIRVGKINVHWGQSQAHRMFNQSDDLNALAPTSGIKCTIVYYPGNTGHLNPAPPTFVDLATGYPSLAGGVIARANQIWADNGGVPFTLVQNSVGGTGIDNWLDNDPGASMTWGLWDLAEAVADALEGQADAVSFDQGTSGLAEYNTYAGKMDLLADKYEELYGEELIFIVHPHPRSDDGPNTWNMRNVQYGKAISGGRWRMGAWALDHQLHSEGDPHQKAGATGNWRRGTHLGRGDANGLYGLSLDISGPAITSVQFTSAARTAFDITYAANIEQADGTAYSSAPIALPSHLFSVSENSGSTFGYTGFTAAIVASNRVRLTKSSGSWPATTTRVDYLRGIPFASDSSNTAEYIGPEADMEADRLSKVLTDTSGFDGGRGMPLAPIMSTGALVEEYEDEAEYTTIQGPGGGRTGTVTLTKAELATLRVKAGATVGANHEPVAIRWFRQAGDTTGSPVDGVNVAVTVTA